MLVALMRAVSILSNRKFPRLVGGIFHSTSPVTFRGREGVCGCSGRCYRYAGCVSFGWFVGGFGLRVFWLPSPAVFLLWCHAHNHWRLLSEWSPPGFLWSQSVPLPGHLCPLLSFASHWLFALACTCLRRVAQFFGSCWRLFDVSQPIRPPGVQKLRGWGRVFLGVV